MDHHPRSVLYLVTLILFRGRVVSSSNWLGERSIQSSNSKCLTRVFFWDFLGPGVWWMLGEVVKVTGPLSYQVQADVGMVRHHIDNIHQRTSEASDTPEEENVIEDFEELTRPTVVDSSIRNPITLPGAVNVSTPSSPVASIFPAEFNSSASVTQDNSIDPDPVCKIRDHPMHCPSRPTSTNCHRYVRHRPPPDYYQSNI